MGEADHKMKDNGVGAAMGFLLLAGLFLFITGMLVIFESREKQDEERILGCSLRCREKGLRYETIEHIDPYITWCWCKQTNGTLSKFKVENGN